jgi:protein-S-isoprenylcysteine O-methyltransferase Ste14
VNNRDFLIDKLRLQWLYLRILWFISFWHSLGFRLAFVGRAFKILMVLIGVAVIFQALGATWFEMLGPLPTLESSATFLAGWCLLMTSLAWLLVAQVQMGNSWRVGIDSENKTALVTTGLFAMSRNPIFLSMRVNLLCLVFVMPSAFTVAALVAGEILMQIVRRAALGRAPRK